MGAFEDYMIANMPIRKVLYNELTVGYDGDPNDGGAPAALKAAPKGTEYYNSANQRWIKSVAGETTWVVSGAEVIFRPGGVQQGNVYTTFTAVDAALAAMGDIPRVLHFDDSVVSPCVVPSGSWSSQSKVLWKGDGQNGLVTQVTIADGASFAGPALTFEDIYLKSEATSSPMTLSNGDRITVRKSADLSCDAGAAPLFDGSGIGAGQFVVLNLEFFAWLGSAIPNNTVIDMSADAAHGLYIQVGENCAVGNNTIASHASGLVSIIVMSTSAFVLEQDNIAGTFLFRSRGYPQYNKNPSRIAAPATANISDVRPGDWILLDATAGSFTQMLPSIFYVGASTTLTDALTCIVTETSGLNSITLDGYGSETIDGASSYRLAPGATVVLISDGISNWTSFHNNRLVNPKTTQSIIAAADTIVAASYNHEISSNAPYTMSSTPTIEDGLDGEEVMLFNAGSNNITLQDETGLAGSNLKLDSATIALTPRDSIRLIFRSSIGYWVQQGSVSSIL